MRSTLRVLLLTSFPQLLLAQAADTSAILGAVSSADRALKVKYDSIDASLCAQGRQQACRPSINRRWTWYVEPGTPPGRLAEMLANADSSRVRSLRSTTPPCPWFPDAAADAGMHLRVSVGVLDDSTAHVTVWRRCANPPGQLHGVIEESVLWEVRRVGHIWKARATRMTAT